MESRVLETGEKKVPCAGVRWRVLIPYVLLHFGFVAAFLNFQMSPFIWSLVILTITGTLGIAVGYHRLLSHQSFDTSKFIRRLHATIGVLTFQLGPISWARLHRAHHAFSDSVDDPHPQVYGFWYGYIGWAIFEPLNFSSQVKWRERARDLISDAYLVFLERYFLHLNLLTLAALFVAGGWEWFLWVGCFRTVVLLHLTWLTNTIHHRWGYRNFETNDRSTNNIFIAPFTWGEAWHNNHHRFPLSARCGLRWFEFDLAWNYIRLLGLLGLAWNIKEPGCYAPDPMGPVFLRGGIHGR